MSIIVPVYNVECFVEKAINSIIDQSLNSVQTIFVNDGSTDDSEMIIRKYLDREDFQLISQPNAGLGAARNTGMKYATGKYILFLDSDDYLESDCLVNMLCEAEKGKLDVLQCTYRHVNEAGENIGGEDMISTTDVMTGAEWIRAGHISYGACFCLYRREFLDEHNLCFMEGVYHEDMDFTLHATYLASRIKSLNYVFYNYLIREASITTHKSVKRCTDYYLVAKNVEKWVDREVDKSTYEAYFREYVNFLFSHVVNLAVQQKIDVKEVLTDDTVRKDILLHLKKSMLKKYRLEYWLLKCKMYGLYGMLYNIFRKDETNG